MKLKYLIADLCDALEDADAFLKSVGDIHGSIKGRLVRADTLRRKIRRRLGAAYKSSEYATAAKDRRTQ